MNEIGVEIQIKSINKSIRPEKEKQWHRNIHPYFTKQAGNVVREYISHFSKKGDIVLDPFSGTGVTAIEALTLRRKAIVVDISPLACFITKQTVISPINIIEFQEAFDKIDKKIAFELKSLHSLGDDEIFKRKSGVRK